MDRRRTITLSVKDDFSRQLREFSRGMEQAGQSAEHLGQRGGRSVLGMAQNLFYLGNSAMMVYGSFQRVLSTASEWAALGAQTQKTAYALEVYAGGAREAERWTQAIVQAMRGTVTEGEAAAQAYTLMKFGLADSTQEAGEFARMLSVVAAANPHLGNTENALAQIQLTLANMSFMRLDQLGLSVTQVKNRMQELQSAMPGLSQEAAFQQAVIEGLKEQADKLGEGIANVTLKQDQLKARIRGFKEEVGAEINEAFETAAGAALDLYDTLVLLTKSPWQVVVNVTQGAIGALIPEAEMATPERRRAWQQLFAVYAGGEMTWPRTGFPARPSFVELPARGGPLMFMTPEELHYYYMRQVTRQAYYEQQAKLYQRFPPLRPYTGIDWAIAPRDMSAIIRGQGDIGFGLFWDRARRAQQAEIDRFQRIYEQQLRQQQRLAAAQFMRGYRAEQYGGALEQWRTIEEQSMGFAGRFGSLALGGPRITAETGGVWGALLTQFDEQKAEKLAKSLERNAEAASKLSAEAQRAGKTLQELWGLRPTDFGASVFQAGQEALQEYGVKGEKAEEALRALAITTGEANAASEIFRLRAEAAAEALAKGRLSAEGYAIQIGLLAREDWTWVDRLMKVPTNEEELRRWVELIEQLASGKLKPAEGSIPDQIAEMQRLFSTGNPLEGFERVSDFLTVIYDKYDDLDAKSGETTQKIGNDMVAAVDLSTKAWAGWREDIVKEIDEVERRMRSFTNQPFTITITSQLSVGGYTSLDIAMGRGYQRGGYTGDGPPHQIAGWVHRGEFVLSQDMLRKMREGARRADFPRMGPIVPGGVGVTISGPVHIHGVQNPAQLLNALEREAARRNIRLGVRQ